nr:HNH endonuclease signature motif containing protein [Mycobacteroides franklinii]
MQCPPELRNTCCTYCGTRRGGTVDHLRPVFRGGTWTRGNLVPACRRCNAFKEARTLTELAQIRPDLALHALWASPLARMEWIRLTAPVELVVKFDRAVGYSPLPPIQSVPLPGRLPPRRLSPRPARLPSARRAFSTLSPNAWFSVPEAGCAHTSRAA